MNLLKSLWPAPSETSISIPKHLEGESEDLPELKKKSLAYFFKRFDIDKYPSFISGISEENGLDFKGVKNIANNKLDYAYNRKAFENLILGNEHRILVDWVKNRFRSLLILSDLGEQYDTQDLQYLGKEESGFKFNILRADDDDDLYIDVIVNQSKIYHEHGLDLDARTNVLKDIIQNQRDLKPSFKKNFNKDDRCSIIVKYVEKISEIVQIERIYKASLLSKLESGFKPSNILKSTSDLTLNNIDEVNESPMNSKTPRLSRSPIRRYSNDPQTTRPQTLSSSPTKLPQLQSTVLTPASPVSSSLRTIHDLNHSSTSLSSMNSNASTSRPPSALRSRSNSPVKSLKKKQSMTLLKMDNSLQQHTRADSFNSDSGTEGISKDEILLIRKQSETAVLTRLERERKLMKA